MNHGHIEKNGTLPIPYALEVKKEEEPIIGDVQVDEVLRKASEDLL